MGDTIPILGAGVTGLAAAWASALGVYEGGEEPGGICSSYYLRPPGLRTNRADPEGYRFDRGGGHWIFGGDPAVLHLISSLVRTRSYRRRSSIFFSRERFFVPYPIQNHLAYLGKEKAARALEDMTRTTKGPARTMADWLDQNFGRTLGELFFGPFHELYTSGLWTRIAPQDPHKSPVDLSLAIRGAFEETPPVGYNVNFLYPEEGLDSLVRCMAGPAEVHYARSVCAVNTDRRELCFSDGSSQPYDRLVSTLPLNRMLELAGLEIDQQPDPYTSVLVLNIGATRGRCCPGDHWLYVPDSASGFYRVGFYSNVDASFVPERSRRSNDRVSIYVERAYPGGQKPTPQAIEAYSAAVVKELQEWHFIAESEVLDPSWVDVAYTWTLPGSGWRSAALSKLEQNDVLMVGRYARWAFQGIGDSIRDGLVAGAACRGLTPSPPTECPP